MTTKEAIKMEWISVDNGLPPIKKKVLVYVKNKDTKGRFNKDGVYIAKLEDKIPKHDMTGKSNFWGIPSYDSEWEIWGWSYFTEPLVTHWMSLPEPPTDNKGE